MIPASISANADLRWLKATLPLLLSSQVQGIEWSYDCLKDPLNLPKWFHDLVEAFSKQSKLYLHGVQFSPCSAQFTENQKNILQQLKDLSRSFKIAHISEHFGFSTSLNLHEGAPLETAYSEVQKQIIIDRLNRISDAAQCPVGIENLAFTFSTQSVFRQADFLSDIVEQTKGFLLLDYHNIYCQSQNFKIDFDQILDAFPNEYIGEVHLSGGTNVKSMQDENITIRRDTHDGAVPPILFSKLEEKITSYSSLQTVCLEYIPKELVHSHSIQNYQTDYLKLVEVLSNSERKKALEFIEKELNQVPIEDHKLQREQEMLVSFLLQSEHYSISDMQLKEFSNDWYSSEWESKMIETAIILAKKYQSELNQV